MIANLGGTPVVRQPELLASARSRGREEAARGERNDCFALLHDHSATSPLSFFAFKLLSDKMLKEEISLRSPI